VCSVTDDDFFIFIPKNTIMFGSGRKSKAPRDVDRVSNAIWMILKFTTILEEAEGEDLEEEFYTPPSSPSERIAWHADQSRVIRFGGERLHTPARAARLLDLHERICDQVTPNQICDGRIQVSSPPKPPMTPVRYKLHTVYIPASATSEGITIWNSPRPCSNVESSTPVPSQSHSYRER
jgi:hypothetical protein